MRLSSRWRCARSELGGAAGVLEVERFVDECGGPVLDAEFSLEDATDMTSSEADAGHVPTISS